MSLDDVADELYGLPPADFMAARQRHVALARADKSRDLAKAIGQLRKPTLAAWAMNQLARAEPDRIERMLELGDALRRAQRTLDAAELRTLSTARQRAVRELTGAAAAIAAERGQTLGEPALRDIRQTLTAALADPDVAAPLRAGRLATGAEYAGFGPAGLSATETEPAQDNSPRAAETDDTAARARRAAELERARAELDRAVEQTRLAAARLAEIDTRIEDLRRRLERAEQERRFQDAAHERARADEAAARHRADPTPPD